VTRVVALLLALASLAAFGQVVPPRALELMPTIINTQRSVWPDAPMPSFLPAQIEQETCPSLKSPKCFNPRAELKTSREYGFGLGQTTIAYRQDGSVRFNKWAELRTRYPSLRGWTWEDRYNPGFQLAALMEMDKASYRLYPFAATPRDRLAFTLGGYNGGDRGNMQDRLLCQSTPGCDSNRWFDNVERYSLKSKIANPGYGKSAFEINREYPRNVLGIRRPKYDPFFRTEGPQ
jgi:hypothetical protein